MSLIKAKENKGVSGLFPEFFSTDFFSDDFFGRSMTKWVPAVNIKENSTAFVVELSAPGFSKEDFKIEISGEDLTIEASRDEEKNESGERFTRKEFMTSSFIRSFRLPQNVKTDHVDAKYENGILKLVLPKREETMQFGPKQVKIS